MRFSYPQIHLQEVPGEISLALSISGCSLKCKGCHSTETWDKNFGTELTIDELNRLILKNEGISCVLFYGGEWEPEELVTYLKYVKSKNLKTALYSGLDNIEDISENIINNLDYLKIGKFIEELGGLNSENTNQRIIKLKEK